MEPKANQKYWNDHWRTNKFLIAPSNHPIRQWIESEIPHTTSADVFEVGCYPGKFLAVFGEKGYTLNGIDSFFQKNAVMEEWLKSEGYKVGKFYQTDFWSLLSTCQYDVVCSFGFIENFKNWDEALVKHIQLTKVGGRIMIDVPNLKSPLYQVLYRVFEPGVLKNHEFSAMNIDAIRSVFEKNGCIVKTATYLGPFYFRFVTRSDRLSSIIAKGINYLKPLFELLHKPTYARYIAISAVKINTG